MVLGHVLMHVWVVLPDVALCAAVRNSSKAERRGVRVWTLKLEVKERKENKRKVKVERQIPGERARESKKTSTSLNTIDAVCSSQGFKLMSSKVTTDSVEER